MYLTIEELLEIADAQHHLLLDQPQVFIDTLIDLLQRWPERRTLKG